MKQVQAYVLEILKATVEVCDKNHIQYYCQAGTVLGAVRHKGPIPWDYDADIIIPNNQIDRFVACCQRDLPERFWVNYHTVAPGFEQFPRIGIKGFDTAHIHLDVFQLIGLPDERDSQLALIQEAVQYRQDRRAYCDQKRCVIHLMKHGQIAKLFKRIGEFVRHDTSFVGRMDELCSRYPYDRAQYVMNPFGRYGEKNIFKKEVYGEGQIVDFADFKVRIPSEVDFYLKQYYGDYMKYPPKEHIDGELNRTFVIHEI